MCIIVQHKLSLFWMAYDIILLSLLSLSISLPPFLSLCVQFGFVCSCCCLCVDWQCGIRVDALAAVCVCVCVSASVALHRCLCASLRLVHINHLRYSTACYCIYSLLLLLLLPHHIFFVVRVYSTPFDCRFLENLNHLLLQKMGIFDVFHCAPFEFERAILMGWRVCVNVCMSELACMPSVNVHFVHTIFDFVIFIRLHGVHKQWTHISGNIL